MNYALVGAFVLLLGAALIAVALWLAAGGAFRQDYDLYLAVEDESVAGLNINAPVKYNGVDVGKVQEIHLDHDNPQRVNLIFAIERGTPIKEDCVAVLKTQGLTGIAYVALSGGARDAAPLAAKHGEPLPEIRTKPSLSARLENILTSVLAKLDNTSSNLNAFLSAENRDAFTAALRNLAAIVQTVAEHQDRLSAGMVDGAHTLANTARASDAMPDLVARVGRGADAIERMGTAVAATSASAGMTVAAVGADVARFSNETLPALQALLSELAVLTSSLQRVSAQIERDPRGMLFGRPPVADGPGEARGVR